MPGRLKNPSGTSTMYGPPCHGLTITLTGEPSPTSGFAGINAGDPTTYAGPGSPMNTPLDGAARTAGPVATGRTRSGCGATTPRGGSAAAPRPGRESEPGSGAACGTACWGP